MLFHVEHQHSWDTCFGGDPEKRKLWEDVSYLAQNNEVTVREFIVNPSEHNFFLVLEAPDYASVERTVGQTKTLGDMRIVPVINWTDLPKPNNQN